MDNKVVQTLARPSPRWATARCASTIRGVGASAGDWDEGRGEVDDALAVIAAHRAPGQPLALGGFSFGGYVAVAGGGPAACRRHAGRAPGAGRPGGADFRHARRCRPTRSSSTARPTRSCRWPPCCDWARPQALPVTVVPGAGHFFHGQLTLLKHIVTGAWHPRAPN